MLFVVVSLVFLAGCGGGGGSSKPSSSPTPTSSPSSSPTASPSPGTGALANGCSTSGTQVAQPGWTSNCAVAIQPTRKWTILLYMNGANNLESFGLLNLNQIESAGGSNSDVTYVAQFKRLPTTDADKDTDDGDWGGARRFVVRADSDPTHIASPEVSYEQTIDMGNPQTLQDFIAWGVQTFPAQHYAIVLWNHGAGWRSEPIPGRATTVTTAASTPATGRGFSYDDEFGTHIDTIQLPAALAMSGGRKWDLIAWDSSLMQMLEVSYEIRNSANYIVGGEESPPGSGYPYDAWTAALNANPDMTAITLGSTICDTMLADYGASSNVTQSVLDTTKITAIASSVNSFASALLAVKTTDATQIVNARNNAEYYDYPENKDLLDFTNQIVAAIPDTNVQKTGAAVQASVKAAVLHNVHADLHPNSNGIAIYIPSPSVYQQDDIVQANGFGQRYSALTISKDYPNWQTFLTQGPP